MSGKAPQPRKNSLLRNLGRFAGHVAKGIKSDPNAPKPADRPVAPMPSPPPNKIVRHEVQEQEVHTPQGKVVLRRTIIDEVERPPQ